MHDVARAGPDGGPVGEAFAIRRLEEADESACAVLLAGALGADERRWLERFAHWRRNPALRPGMPTGWVARGRDGGLAGFLGNAPFLYVDESGGRLTCYAAHTLAVSPDARGHGLARRLVFEAYRQPCDFSVGSQTSAGGGKATVAGGGGVLDRPWTREPKIVVADWAALARRVTPGPAWLGASAAAVARVAGAAAGLLDRQSGEVEVGAVEAFESTDDPLLARFAAGPARIRPLRDAGILNWMYFGTPALRRSRLVLAARRQGRLAGYAGFRRLADSLVLLEARALPEEKDALPALIRAARAWAKDRRMSHILVWPHSPWLVSALPRAATFPAPRRLRFPYFIVLKRPGLKIEELELGPWDGDAVIADDSPQAGEDA